MQHLGGVGELGDVGPDEAGELDPAQAAGREQLDECDLVVGGDDLGLVLEAVAGTDLAYAHPARQHGRNL